MVLYSVVAYVVKYIGPLDAHVCFIGVLFSLLLCFVRVSSSRMHAL
jgi:hypothetical protein